MMKLKSRMKLSQPVGDAAGADTALTADRGALGSCDSACRSSAPTLRVTSSAPVLTAARFAAPYRHVTVTFDVPVWTGQGCEELLDADTLLALGEPGKEPHCSNVLLSFN